MHAVAVLTAAYPGNVFRFTVHPGPRSDFPDTLLLAGDVQPRASRIPLHKDSQGMLQARQKAWTFVLDPPTGAFRIAHQNQELLSGSVQTGQFALPEFFARHSPGDLVYGFGAANGRLAKNETNFRLLNLDTLLSSLRTNSYSSFPFFLIGRPEGFVGVFLNTLCPADVQIHDGETNPLGPGTQIRFAEATPQSIDVFVFAGTPAEILDAYSSFTGRPFLPPTWSLGFHQSRWSYRTAARVEQLAQRFRTEDVPCDAIHLDIHYMDRYRVFTWDPKRFGDPEALHAHLAELGIRTVAIVDPGIAVAGDYSVYVEGLAAGAFCKRSDGSIYEGKAWPGRTVFPDFTSEDVRTWWAREHRALLGRGVSGIWNDMNDPVLWIGKRYDPLSEDLHHATARHSEVRNGYANLEAEATSRAFALHQPESRPFVLTRSATSGIQKHAAVWTGDNISSWAHLSENLSLVLSLGLSGVPFSGADIGGFAGRPGITGVFKWRPSAELFIRWVQLGALLPFFRAHTALYSPDQEPWSFGDEALRIVRRHIKRRYRLLPYIYTLFWQSSQNGSPVVRPLFFRYPKAPAERQADQFLLGDDLLVAPVLAKGARSRPVYLPEGEWYDYNTGQPFSGGSTFEVQAPLDTCPLFVRAGTILPVCRAAHNAPATLAGEPTLEIYPAAQMQGMVYIDDGLSLDYRRDRYLLLEASGKQERGGNLTLRLTARHRRFQPPYREMQLRAPGQYSTAVLRDKVVEGQRQELSQEDRTVVVSRFSVPLLTPRVEIK